MSEIESLWARHLAGEALDGAEMRALVAAGDRDEAFRRQVLDDSALDAVLHQLARRPDEVDRFVESFAEIPAADRKVDAFVDAFRGRIDADAQGPRAVVRRWLRPWTVTLAGVAVMAAAVALRWERPVAEPVATHVPSPAAPEPDTTIAAGEVIRTGVAERRMIHHGLATFSLAPSTTVRTGGSGLEVIAGVLRAEAEAQPAGNSLVVVTPHAQVVVTTAATFVLTVDARRTLLEVADGQVGFVDGKSTSPRVVGATRNAQVASPVRPPRKFDFEDGALPEGFGRGDVQAGPPRAGNKFALLGTVNLWEPKRTAVSVHFPDETAIPFSPTLVIAFDYWVGNEGGPIVLQLWSKDRAQTYRGRLKANKLETGTWAHARFAVKGLWGHGSSRLTPGAHIHGVTVIGGYTGGALFYVDNLKILDPVGGGGE